MVFTIKGFAVTSIFSLAYIITPPYVFYCLYSLARDPCMKNVYISIPLFLSIIIPPIHSPWVVKQFLKPMIKYFDYEEVNELSDRQLLNRFAKNKSYILAAVPHGVISFGGITSATYAEPDEFREIQTAVASVILSTPILKHVLGIFGLISASSSNLKKHFKKGGAKGSVVIYIGGIAELFMSSRKVEKLYLNKRKGFVKLALRNGVDIIPIYLFGNTSVLTVWKSGPLATLSRSLGVSLTYFWGVFGLPIPRPDKLLYVRGKPLGLPHILEPTDEDVDKWHAKYKDEIRRIFEENKEKVPLYKDKELIIV